MTNLEVKALTSLQIMIYKFYPLDFILSHDSRVKARAVVSVA
jgi:hypothetical protein